MYNYGNVELGSLMTLAILAISGIGSHVVLRSALIFRDGKADDNRVCGTRDHTVMVDKTRLVGFVRRVQRGQRPTEPRPGVPEQKRARQSYSVIDVIISETSSQAFRPRRPKGESPTRS